MRISRKISIELARQILVNLTSAWLGIILVAPGFFGEVSLASYLRLLLTNLPFAILGLVVSYWLMSEEERVKIK